MWDYTLKDLEQILLEYLRTAYAGWSDRIKLGIKEREPSIGIGEMTDYIEQHSVRNIIKNTGRKGWTDSEGRFHPFEYADKKRVRSVVETTVRRMVRQGLMIRTTGLVRGREVHVYEPSSGW